jgi:hypothetical protein
MSQPESRSTGWPAWARRVVSIVLAFHLAAMLAVALSGMPASPLEREIAGLFVPYVELTGLGHLHRYYAPAPPPTPIVTAEVRFADGRPPLTVRIPDRAVRPRLRYQRQLALAYHLYNDYQQASHHPDGPHPSRWGASYARHLRAIHPGSAGVTIRAQQHLVPDLVRLRAIAEETGQPVPSIDPDDPSFFTVPEVVFESPVAGVE